jgi:hypothetical protein
MTWINGSEIRNVISCVDNAILGYLTLKVTTYCESSEFRRHLNFQ